VTSSVLVTGAAGFVGGHLLDRLAATSAVIAAWYRPGWPPLTPRPDVHWAAVELLDRDAVATAIATIAPDTIYHLAGAAHVAQSWRHASETYQGNVLATHHLLAALRAARLRPRVVIAGSATIYRKQDRAIVDTDPVGPQSPYATSKLAQELLGCQAWTDDAIPVVVARSFNHIGPGQHESFVASSVARQIARIESRRQPPVLTLGNLDARRDLTDVRDTVRAYEALAARGRPGQTYNVCSGRALAIRELVDSLCARARVPVTLAQDPALLRPSDTPLMLGDHARLTADTGWQPAIPMDQTLDDLLDYWRARTTAELTDEEKAK
jgi:GDP-4-dehydro-6-deoxy-D-mannose reductase